MQHRKLQNACSSTKRVLALLKGRKRTTAFLLVLIVVTSMLEITIPFLTQRLIDSIIRSVKRVDHFALPVLFTSLAAIFFSVAATRILRSVYNFNLFKTVTSTEDEVKSAA